MTDQKWGTHEAYIRTYAEEQLGVLDDPTVKRVVSEVLKEADR